MNEQTLEMIAERFRVLGDPLRLRLLHAMAAGELSVSELVTTSGTSQANVSKHLGMLLRAGLIRRRKEGLRVYYAPADPSVFKICDLVCGSLQDRLARDLSDLDGSVAPAARRQRAARLRKWAR
jgi:DNA-binding transcriptional ArsR family regulator